MRIELGLQITYDYTNVDSTLITRYYGPGYDIWAKTFGFLARDDARSSNCRVKRAVRVGNSDAYEV